VLYIDDILFNAIYMYTMACYVYDSVRCCCMNTRCAQTTQFSRFYFFYVVATYCTVLSVRRVLCISFSS